MSEPYVIPRPDLWNADRYWVICRCGREFDMDTQPGVIAAWLGHVWEAVEAGDTCEMHESEPW